MTPRNASAKPRSASRRQGTRQKKRSSAHAGWQPRRQRQRRRSETPSAPSKRHPGNSGHCFPNCLTRVNKWLPAVAEDFLRKTQDIGKSAVFENPKEAVAGQFVFRQGGACKAAQEARDL